MKKINFEEYKRRVNKKEVKQSLAELANALEIILFDSKKWVAVVLIPTIDILLNVIALLNDDRDWRD